MNKRAGDIEITSKESKDSSITICVHYSKDCSQEVWVSGYESLCDLEYLIKTLKRHMEEPKGQKACISHH